jgi:hypothetical protein
MDVSPSSGIQSTPGYGEPLQQQSEDFYSNVEESTYENEL